MAIEKRRLVVTKVDGAGYTRDLFLSCRDPATSERLTLHILDFYPYIYCSQDNEVPIHDAILDVESGHISINGESMQKLVLSSPSVIKSLRGQLRRLGEADIPLTQRFIVDTLAQGTVDLRLEEGLVDERLLRGDPPRGVNEVHISGDALHPPGIYTPGIYEVSYKALEPVSNEITTPLHILYFDIEVAADTTQHQSPEQAAAEAADPIIAIAVRDRQHDAWIAWLYDPQERPISIPTFVTKSTKKEVPVDFRAFTDERDMLTDFSDWFAERQPDVLAGWFSNTYDVPYIINRMKRLGLSADRLAKAGYVSTDPLTLPGVQLIDLMEAFKKTAMGEVESASLKAVAKEKCGIELHKDPKAIAEWWREDPESLMVYNLLDVDATQAIDVSQDYSGWQLRYAYFTYVDNVNDVMSASVIHDVAALIEARGIYVLPMKPTKIVCPTCNDKGKVGKDKCPTCGFQGAIIMAPTPGLHRNVAVFDFWAMYPNIVIGANISYETLTSDGDIVLGNGKRLKSSPEGLMPRVLRKLFKLREYYDKLYLEETDVDKKKFWFRMRDPLKRTMAGAYGVLGYRGFRLYKKPIAESVTFLGRTLITEAKKYVESRGFKVIYGDTDSMFIAMGDVDPIVVGEQLRKELAEHLVQFAPSIGLRAAEPDRFLMDFEKLYDRFLIGSEKKRYVGRKTWDEGKPCKPHLDIKGFDWRRSETPAYSVELQEKVFNMLIDGATPNAVYDAVNAAYCEVRSGKVEPLRAAARPSLKRGIDGYAGGFYAATAAKWSRDHYGVQFNPGSRVYCVYVKKVPPKTQPTHLVGLSEDFTALPEGVVPDWEKMAEVAVKAKVESVFETIGIGDRVVRLGKRTLFEF